MTTFYIVRHGETLWNKEHRLQGWLNSPLSTDGIMNAKKLGEQLKSVPFAAAYCSTTDRAKETLQHVLQEKDLPIYYEDNLREINLGNWQGMTIEEIREQDRLDYELYTDYPGQYIATHTESFGAVTERAMYTLKCITNRFPNDSILVISHAVTIKCMINAILERSIDQVWSPPNIEATSVTIVDAVDGQWTVKEIGSTLHL